MLEQCNVVVTPGNKLSVFSAMATFLQVKTSERMTNKSFDVMLAAFRKAFPDASELPHTYSKMKNFLCAVGIGYDMIHVCKIIVLCSGGIMPTQVNARNANHQDGKMAML